MRCLLTFFLAGLPLVASGGVTFSERNIELNSKPADEKVSFVFNFINDGKDTVHIEDVHVSCACLSAKTDKLSYATGEKGRLEAVFAIGSFTGVQRKTLTLVSRDGDSKEHERNGLLAILNIPDVITITPELLQWAVGEKPAEKAFMLKVTHSKPVHIKEVTCSREGFVFRVVEKEKGRVYEIYLKPQQTGKPMLGLLKVDTDCEILKHRRKLAFFSIVRKRRS
jgi:hypothetical protein